MKKNKISLLAMTMVLAMGSMALAIPQLFSASASQSDQLTGRDAELYSRLLIHGFENYDIRLTQTQQAHSDFSSLNQALDNQQDSLVEMQREMIEAEANLSRKVPGLTIEYNQALSAPEIVEARADTPVFLTAASNEPREKILRRFITENSKLYGLSRSQVKKLKKIADYTNPSGNLSWVTLQQEIKGIPVFQGEMTAAFTPAGELARAVSRFIPGVDYSSTPDTPLIDAAEALTIAADSIDVVIAPASLSLKAASAKGRDAVFEAGPFAEETRMWQVYFPLKAGTPALAWAMTLWEDDSAYYTLVDAMSGKLLFRKNITETQTQNATYVVYDNDSPAPLSPTNATPGSGIQGAGIARTSFTFVSELPAFDNLGWINDGGNTTTGNNVDAGLDVKSPNGIDSNGRPTGSPTRVFNFTYNPSPVGSDAPTGTNFRWGAVTNIFFWSNRYHDKLYSLGFTEPARNFQNDNFGRGGAGNDRVRAEVQDFSGTNNANFSTPADGSLPRMQMYVFTGPTPDRDGDLDGDVFIHELTHGTSNRLHSNASGLSATQSRGMGEGWSDFYARALLATSDEDVNGVYASGAYVTLNFSSIGTDNYYYGIRRFPYAVKTTVGPNGKPHNPLTFADIDAAKINVTDGAFPKNPAIGNTANEVHNIGEVWCMALLEVRARLITRLGFSVGNQRMLQIVTDAMKLDPVNPTLLNGRDSLIAADNASFGGADVADIWAGFATRGMGVNATVTPSSSSSITVTEDFSVPAPFQGAVSRSDANKLIAADTQATAQPASPSASKAGKAEFNFTAFTPEARNEGTAQGSSISSLFSRSNFVNALTGAVRSFSLSSASNRPRA